LSAARFAEVVRAHWQIENVLHWVLDVVMDEDQARARKDHAPENLARLRRFALNLLRANTNKGSTRGKFKRAGWNDAFLLKILAAA
jgi:predicted transposase YbfD/YdcC